MGNNRFLVWGGQGWVAGHLKDLLEKQGKEVFTTTVRMQNREAVIAEIEKIKPTHIFNAAGSTGRPNVDWCEDHKEETIRNNVIGTLNLADVAFERGIHVTVFATGCIYHYDNSADAPARFKENTGSGFLETDKANFAGSFYSETKAYVEEIMKHYTNTLILRLRMPVSDDWNPRNFVKKIAGYQNIVNIPNSHSILYELLPASVALAEHKETGVYNFTNPGAIDHKGVLAILNAALEPILLKKIESGEITKEQLASNASNDPTKEQKDPIKQQIQCGDFNVVEQSKVIKAGRSNCKLDTDKLINKIKEYNDPSIDIHPIDEAYVHCFQRLVADEAAVTDILEHMAYKRAHGGNGAAWVSSRE